MIFTKSLKFLLYDATQDRREKYYFGHYLILNRVIARQEGQLKWLPETYTDLIEPKKIDFN